MNVTCANCVFAGRTSHIAKTHDGESEVYVCNYEPPVPISVGRKFESRKPTVLARDWCAQGICRASGQPFEDLLVERARKRAA